MNDYARRLSKHMDSIYKEPKKLHEAKHNEPHTYKPYEINDIVRIKIETRPNKISPLFSEKLYIIKSRNLQSKNYKVIELTNEGSRPTELICAHKNLKRTLKTNPQLANLPFSESKPITQTQPIPKPIAQLVPPGNDPEPPMTKKTPQKNTNPKQSRYNLRTRKTVQFSK